MDNEEHLIRILERMEQNQKEFSKDTIDKFSQIVKTFQKMSDDAKKDNLTKASNDRRLRSTLRTPSQGEKKVEDSLKREADIRKKAANDLETTSAKMKKSGNALVNILNMTTDNLLEVLGELKALPLVGGLAASGLVGMMVKTYQDTISSYRKINKQGVVLGDSLLNVNTAAVKSGYGLVDFANIVSENAKTIQRYGIVGIMDTVEHFAKATDHANRSLRDMGYTTRDITTHMFGYLDLQRKSGLDTVLDDEKTRQGAIGFAQMLERLSMQTGRSIDELRASIVKQADDPIMVNLVPLLEGMGADVAKNVLAVSEALGTAVPTINSVFASIMTGSGDGLKTMAMMDTFDAGFTDKLRMMMSGNADADDINAHIREFAANLSSDDYAEKLTMLNQSIAPDAKEIATIFTQLVAYGRGIAADPTGEQIAAKHKVQKETNVFDELLYTVKNELFGPLIEMMAEMEPAEMKKFTDMISNAASMGGDLLRDGVKAMPEFFADGGKFDQYVDKVVDTGMRVYDVTNRLIDKINQLIDMLDNIWGILGQIVAHLGIGAAAVWFGRKMLGETGKPGAGGGGPAGGGFGRTLLKGLGGLNAMNEVGGLGIEFAGSLMSGKEITPAMWTDLGLTIAGGIAGGIVGGPAGAVFGAGFGGNVRTIFGDQVGEVGKGFVPHYTEDADLPNPMGFGPMSGNAGNEVAPTPPAGSVSVELLNGRKGTSTDAVPDLPWGMSGTYYGVNSNGVPFDAPVNLPAGQSPNAEGKYQVNVNNAPQYFSPEQIRALVEQTVLNDPTSVKMDEISMKVDEIEPIRETHTALLTGISTLNENFGKFMDWNRTNSSEFNRQQLEMMSIQVAKLTDISDSNNSMKRSTRGGVMV